MHSSNRFVCKNNGVLFENQLLQIGIKSEYRQNLGELSSVNREIDLIHTWAGCGMTWFTGEQSCGGLLIFFSL